MVPCNSTINNSKISSDDIFSIMQIVKIDATKKSVTKMTIALLHICTLKQNKQMSKKILLALYTYMSDSKRNGQPVFIQNVLLIFF